VHILCPQPNTLAFATTPESDTLSHSPHCGSLRSLALIGKLCIPQSKQDATKIQTARKCPGCSICEMYAKLLSQCVEGAYSVHTDLPAQIRPRIASRPFLKFQLHTFGDHKRIVQNKDAIDSD
jgi:hypothetical protein